MIMTPNNPRWDEFYERLSGKEGCDFREDLTWKCNGTTQKAEQIMRDMGLSENEIERSLMFFRDHGGFCDCEIVFNIESV